MKKFLLVFLLVILFMFSYLYLSYPNFDEIKVGLKNKYKDFSKGVDSDKLTYKRDVLFENEIGLTFPQDKVESAKVFGDFYSLPKKLNHQEISFLVKKFNDSSTFRWGETGTFVHYKTIVFYNDKNEIIGITEVDEDLGQTYSIPMIKKMKWGYLVLSDENDSKYFRNIVNY